MARVSKHAAVVSGGRGAHGGNDGGTGAPPSNTAPDNSNDMSILPALRLGLDSLYLSYPGELSTGVMEPCSRPSSTKAQAKDLEAIKAQLKLGRSHLRGQGQELGHVPLCPGRRRLPDSPVGPARRSCPWPTCRSRSGLPGAQRPARRSHEELRELLPASGGRWRAQGQPDRPGRRFRVHAGHGLLAPVGLGHAGHRNPSVRQGPTFTGWTIGMGGHSWRGCTTRSLECHKTGKDYLLEPLA